MLGAPTSGGLLVGPQGQGWCGARSRAASQPASRGHSLDGGSQWVWGCPSLHLSQRGHGGRSLWGGRLRGWGRCGPWGSPGTLPSFPCCWRRARPLALSPGLRVQAPWGLSGQRLTSGGGLWGEERGEAPACSGWGEPRPGRQGVGALRPAQGHRPDAAPGGGVGGLPVLRPELGCLPAPYQSVL